MTVSLRRHRESDWPEILNLWVETWTLARPGVDFAARAPWLAELFAGSIARGAQIVIAEDAEGPIGFVLYEASRNWLEQIAVHPRAQGSGAAQALIACAKQDCADGIGLDVNADNFRALAFYRGEGFVRVGEGCNPRSGLPTVVLRWTPGRSTPWSGLRSG